MNNLPWFERNLKFGYPKEMLPYFLERLEGSIVRIQAKIADIDDKILSERLNDKWSIKQNIGHLAEWMKSLTNGWTKWWRARHPCHRLCSNHRITIPGQLKRW